MSTAICSQSAVFDVNVQSHVFFEQNSTNHLIKVMSMILNELISETTKNFTPFPSVFNCRSPPKISIRKYLERIEVYGRASKECFILALIYLDRISEFNTNFLITPLNVHRLLITSFMVAAKFFEEDYFPNNFYAKIGGITLEDINQLEIEFLSLINFKLFVDENLFSQYEEKLLYCD